MITMTKADHLRVEGSLKPPMMTIGDQVRLDLAKVCSVKTLCNRPIARSGSPSTQLE